MPLCLPAQGAPNLAQPRPALPPPPAVIIACAVGGTLDTVVRVASTGKSASDPDRAFGRETRSLKACYELLNAGYSNVVHLKGGLSSWCAAAVLLPRRAPLCCAAAFQLGTRRLLVTPHASPSPPSPSACTCAPPASTCCPFPLCSLTPQAVLGI